jgi:CHAD domain-containing protein
MNSKSVIRPSVNKVSHVNSKLNKPVFKRPGSVRKLDALSAKIPAAKNATRPQRALARSPAKKVSEKPRQENLSSLNNKKASESKKQWLQILNDPESKKLLNKVWSAPNPQKKYQDTIAKLSEKIK